MKRLVFLLTFLLLLCGVPAAASRTNPQVRGVSGDGAISGDLLYCPAATSDVDPDTCRLTGSDAWLRATAGQRDGGSLNLSGGPGTNNIVCDNFAWAAGDIVGLIVDGVTTNLTEGVEFSVGADDELTCDALGVAIVTAALGITPDCDTTAGTCYLAFLPVIETFDMTITDGAADGVFATLIEGLDGPVTFSSHAAVTGSDPVLSACGTTPTVVGADTAGKITIGTGATTSCTSTFAAAFPSAPACIIAGDNTAVTYAATTTATVLTIISSADMASDVISFICIGL